MYRLCSRAAWRGLSERVYPGAGVLPSWSQWQGQPWAGGRWPCLHVCDHFDCLGGFNCLWFWIAGSLGKEPDDVRHPWLHACNFHLILHTGQSSLFISYQSRCFLYVPNLRCLIAKFRLHFHLSKMSLIGYIRARKPIKPLHDAWPNVPVALFYAWCPYCKMEDSMFLCLFLLMPGNMHCQPYRRQRGPHENYAVLKSLS